MVSDSEHKTIVYSGNNKKYQKLGGWSISETLLNWITDNIPFGSTILEFGSGQGTKHLVKNYTVFSIEQNEEWVNYEPNSNYIFAPIVDGWYDIEIVKDKLPKKYDLLLIDGPIGDDRINFLNHYNHFNLKIPIIIDDTNRVLDNEMSIKLKNLLNKKSIKFDDGEKFFTVLL